MSWPTSIFVVQDEVTLSIVGTLAVQLEDEQTRHKLVTWQKDLGGRTAKS